MAIAGFLLSLAGLIMGIIGGWSAYTAVFGLPVAVVGLVLSAISRKKKPSGLGTAGLVLGIIATVFTAITFFTCGLCVICAAAASASV